MNRVFENNPKSLILREINFSFLFHYFLVDEDRNYTTCYSSQGVVQIVEEAILTTLEYLIIVYDPLIV